MSVQQESLGQKPQPEQEGPQTRDPRVGSAGLVAKPPQNCRLGQNWDTYLTDPLIGYGIQCVLGFSWFGMGLLLYFGLIRLGPVADTALLWAVAALCLLPKLLMFCVALLLKRQQMRRTHFRLKISSIHQGEDWKHCREAVEDQWDMEVTRAKRNMERMTQALGTIPAT